MGYSYYDVTPNTTYKLCQELTINPLAIGCDGGRFGSVCPVLFAYEPCFLTLGTETRTCNPEGTEYTLTVPFTGGGTRAYTITGATNTGANPSSVASGNMTFGPFTQGTSYSINITGGTCDIDIVGSYTCIPPCDFAPETIADFSVTCGNSATLNIGAAPALYGFGDIGEFAGTCTEIPSTGHTPVTLGDDAVTTDLNVGFSFNFFGNTYTQFRIHSNGFISFGGQTYTGFANFSIPNATDPDNFIAGLYGDLNPSCGGSVTYSTIGSAPNRQLVVTFSDIEPYQSGCDAPATEAVSFQIVLNENGSFYVVIIDYPPTYGASTTIGSNVTSGYENADGTIADAATGYNGQSGAWIDESAGALPKCWGAYPLANPCVFDRWEDASGATIGTTASLSVTPSTTTTYTAVWNCAGTECTDPLTVTVTGSPPTTTGATICAGGSGTLTSGAVCPSQTLTGSTSNIVVLNGTSSTSAPVSTTFTPTVPAGAVVTGISYTSNTASTTDWRSELRFQIIRTSTMSIQGSTATSAGSVTIPAGTSTALNSNAATGTWTVQWIDITSPYNVSVTSQSITVTINYSYTAPGTLEWYTAATGGTPVQTGSPFNPVGDAEVIAAGAPYSSLTNTNTPGTYTFYAACSSAPNCRTATDFVISTAPNAGTLSGTQNVCGTGTTTFASNGDTGGTWSSSNTAVATVNASGDVTGVAAGTATITYSVAATSPCTTAATATRTVTVVAPPNAGTLSGSQNVCGTGTTTFASNGDTGGTWSSSNTAVATVNASGDVTGVAAGTATITYSVACY